MKVKVTLVAKSMQEVAMRYDTYNNLIAQSPKAEENASAEGMFVEPIRQQRGDLFEITVEFDLHSVMAQTYHSMRPVRPKNTIRKYK